MNGRSASGGPDRTTIRLAVFGLLLVAAFVALFARLWFLQVLAAPEYREAAKENRVRFVHSEPPRGRILDRDGRVLVTNRTTFAVTVARDVSTDPRRKRIVLEKLSRLLDTPVRQLRKRLVSERISPYKPVPVAYNVPARVRDQILENQEDYFGGVDIERVPQRVYPHGKVAGHILGYVREISAEQLKSDHFKEVRPRYRPGDLVGHDGLEYTYDRFLRGTPQIEKMIVNSAGDVLDAAIIRDEHIGDDLRTSLDLQIQKVTEDALAAGIFASRGSYQAPAGAAVVMDVNTGGVVAMASFPSYSPRVFNDTLTPKEYKALGAGTKTPDDDALLNRAIQAQRSPASTMKIVTAGAAMWSGIATPYTTLDCPSAAPYPPEGRTDPGSAEIFNNWTTLDLGFMGFPESLEVSCDTFYYELGWRMEDAFGASIFGTPQRYEEKFQEYARRAGLGNETGVDLPNEMDGLVPDWKWCQEQWRATRRDRIPTCGTKDGPVWLPGYTVNMAIGQGDLLTTPIQMAVTTAAVANGGTVWQPHFAEELVRFDDQGKKQTVRDFDSPPASQLGLDELELAQIRTGMEDVVAGGGGTARPAFYGFPLTAYPVAGKTGTSELGETDLQDAWFVSYAPADAPEYAIAVYVEKAGHGGESAAPIAREIYEGIFELDEETSVQLGQDESG